MEQLPKYKKIHALWLAIELQKRGQNVVMTMKDPLRPKYTNWVFEDTPEFEKTMTEIFQEK